MAENGEKQAVIVLTVQGQDNNTPVIYFSCFNTLEDAQTHCKIVNTIKQNEHEWVYSRIINYSEKYRVSKPAKFSFDIINMLSVEDLGKITSYWCSREGKDDYEFYFLFQALKGTSDEIMKRFFNDKNVNGIDWETLHKKQYETFEDFKSLIESLEISPCLIKEAQDEMIKTIIELSINGKLLYPLIKIEEDKKI